MLEGIREKTGPMSNPTIEPPLTVIHGTIIALRAMLILTPEKAAAWTPTVPLRQVPITCQTISTITIILTELNKSNPGIDGVLFFWSFNFQRTNLLPNFYYFSFSRSECIRAVPLCLAGRVSNPSRWGGATAFWWKTGKNSDAMSTHAPPNKTVLEATCKGFYRGL
jgi:hypothetical protein